MKQKIQAGGVLDILAPHEFLDAMERHSQTLTNLLGRNAQFKRVIVTGQANATGQFELDASPPDGFMWDVRAISFQSPIVNGTFTTSTNVNTAGAVSLTPYTGQVQINSVIAENNSAATGTFLVEDNANNFVTFVNGLVAGSSAILPIYTPLLVTNPRGVTSGAGSSGIMVTNYTIAADMCNVYINDTSSTLNLIDSVSDTSLALYSKQIILHANDVLKFVNGGPLSVSLGHYAVMLWVIEVPRSHMADLLL